ncbi:DUF86 domain-containing protein [bacterium]|nr:DUF86 domain-containing protein [bacterium]
MRLCIPARPSCLKTSAARITDYRRIIAFRNVLIHGYDVIDPAIVWSAVEVDLAPLLADVQLLLNSVG